MSPSQLGREEAVRRQKVRLGGQVEEGSERGQARHLAFSSREVESLRAPGGLGSGSIQSLTAMEMSRPLGTDGGKGPQRVGGGQRSWIVDQWRFHSSSLLPNSSWDTRA